MSSDLALKVCDVTKTYRLGLAGGDTFREVVMDALRSNPFKPRVLKDRFRALNGVSFDVRQGEVLGIIGRNGAGKSTMLKIISRITLPDAGYVEMWGRVGSLLEVGTGFHPELTGRENVFLNGAILGMRRREIMAKFDAIVEFAGVSPFIDTPVKRYSSGMYVRLAFAVAAHLDSEILILDEVLAVGDTAFQARCLQKIEELAMGDGRSILFVTHSMASLRRLCSRAVVLQEGSILFDGDAGQAVASYTAVAAVTANEPGAYDLGDRVNSYPPHEILIKSLRVTDPTGQPTESIPLGGDLNLLVALRSCNLATTFIGVRLSSDQGFSVATLNTSAEPALNSVGVVNSVVLSLPAIALTPGQYAIDISVQLKDGPILDFAERAGSVRIGAPEEAELYRAAQGDGAVRLSHEWRVNGDG